MCRCLARYWPRKLLSPQEKENTRKALAAECLVHGRNYHTGSLLESTPLEFKLRRGSSVAGNSAATETDLAPSFLAR